jgi:hypothetical protein
MRRVRGGSKESRMAARSDGFENFGLLHDLKMTVERYLKFAECVRGAQFTGLEYSSRYLDCLSGLSHLSGPRNGFDNFLGGVAQLSVIDSFVQAVQLDWTCSKFDGLWRDMSPYPRDHLSADYGVWLDLWKALYPCHTTIATYDVCIRGLSGSTPVSLLQYQIQCLKAMDQQLAHGSTHQNELQIRVEIGPITSPVQKTRLFRRHNSTKAINACIKVCNEHRNSPANRARIGPGPDRVSSIDYNCPLTDPETFEYCTTLINKQHQTIEIMCGVFGGSCLFAFVAIVLRLFQESRRKDRFKSRIRQPQNTPNESRVESGTFSGSTSPVPVAISATLDTTVSKPWYTRTFTELFPKPRPVEALAPTTREIQGPSKLTKPPSAIRPPISVPTIVVDRVRTRSRASHVSVDSSPAAGDKDIGTRVVSTGSDVSAGMDHGPSLRRGHGSAGDGDQTVEASLESSQGKRLNSQSHIS